MLRRWLPFLIVIPLTLLIWCSAERSSDYVGILPEEERVSEIRNEELVTVTESSFIVTWVTDSESRSVIYYGEKRGELMPFVCERELTRYHYCEVVGLVPGRTYYYQTAAGRVRGEPSEFSPGVVTTLVPPDGEFIFSFATINDLHFGEDIAGLITTPDGKAINEGMSWPDKSNPHWSFMNRAAIEEINQRNVDFVVVNGDITSKHRREEFEVARSYLSLFKMPYIVLRGNHDVVGEEREDHFVSVFDLKNFSPIGGARYIIDDYGHVYISFVHKGILFVGLDSSDLKDGWGRISEEQLNWLENILQENRDKVTIIFLHYPVVATRGDSLGSISVINDRHSRNRLIDIISKNRQVKVVFSGHTHRNKVTPHDGVIFAEIASVKDYPGGYAIHKVHKGGIMTNFFKTRCPECRQWSDMGKTFRFLPGSPEAQYILLGDLRERNYVVRWN